MKKTGLLFMAVEVFAALVQDADYTHLCGVDFVNDGIGPALHDALTGIGPALTKFRWIDAMRWTCQ